MTMREGEGEVCVFDQAALVDPPCSLAAHQTQIVLNN